MPEPGEQFQVTGDSLRERLAEAEADAPDPGTEEYLALEALRGAVSALGDVDQLHQAADAEAAAMEARALELSPGSVGAIDQIQASGRDQRARIADAAAGLFERTTDLDDDLR